MRGTVAVLGAGPAGLGAAFALARRKAAPVVVLEQSDRPGGNAGSFLLDGIPVDFGSHRLHPSCDPRLLADLREALGADLLDRPRHGRIRLRGRWIHFPLKPLDLAVHLPPSFALGAAWDTAAKPFRSRRAGPETFASVLEAGLGATICRDFYFPYARKIWGLAPEALSPVQARRRVSGSSPARLLSKLLAAVPGLRRPGAGRFFYPRLGFGQICDAFAGMAGKHGAQFILRARVTRIEGTGGRYLVRYESGGVESCVEAESVWSTLPLTIAARILQPGPPDDVAAAAGRMRFRAMLLIYLVIEQGQFTEYDAHYFPEEAVPIARLSEPKNYTGSNHPPDRTVLCAELPCETGSAHWEMADDRLGALVCESLAAAGIPVRARISQVAVRRLPNAYPLYSSGYEANFEAVDAWLQTVPGFLSFGRQGLFAHDNTHHALLMGYSAAECFDPEYGFDAARWQEFRRRFESHVVED